MNFCIAGFEGPVARETRAELERRGHTAVSSSEVDCLIYFPGSADELKKLGPAAKRVVVRSHAYAYGANPKNPGLLTEDRVSLLAPADTAQKWLQAEDAAAANPNWAAVRLTNVADPAERDLITTRLVSPSGSRIAGRDPNIQFITVADAARVLAAAAESSATGIFNAAGEGSIPLKKAFRAAGTRQIAAPEMMKSLHPMRFNWTVSNERARRELDWVPQVSTVEALREMLTSKKGSHPELLKPAYDDWGVDVDYIRAWGGWFSFLKSVYWRIDSEGMENIPETGKGLYVSNHRGFMPLDAVMHLSLVFSKRNRVIRFLIIHSLLRTPFLGNFLTKLGGVIASQENAQRLFEQGNIVGIFPEGIRGTFLPYKRTYKLRDFHRSEFAKIAIENQAPILPSVVIGHAEIFPIIGRIDSSWVVKELGWPYLPIAPMFPLAPIPMPVKWHVRVLKPIPLDGLQPADAQNDRLMKEFSRYVQDIVQKNIDDMLPRRKSVLFGKVLNGTGPVAAPFHATRRSTTVD